MNYTAHKIGGLSLGAAVALSMFGNPVGNSLVQLQEGIVIGASMIGAMLPDIDHPNSKISKKARITSRVVNTVAGHRGLLHAPLFVVLLWILFRIVKTTMINSSVVSSVISLIISMAVPFAGIIIALMKRGRISVTATMLIGMVFYWISQVYSMEMLYQCFTTGIITGYISHLAMDSMTRTGIPLLYPITNRKYHVLSLKTGRDDLLAALIFLVGSLSFCVFFLLQ